MQPMTNSIPDLPEEHQAQFWARVDVRGPDECWPWFIAKPYTYGVFKGRPSTHVALQLDGRPRHDGLSALHSCDNPPCCNPAHLRWGTHAENMADASKRNRHKTNDALSWSAHEVRAARLQLGMTQKQLAEALGLPASGKRTVRHWETDAGRFAITGPARVAIRLMLTMIPATTDSDRSDT
jgi:DNA-binding transcriptional regulator YiaG